MGLPGSKGSGQDATRASLQSAQAPANCEIPAQRLINGKTSPKYAPASGGLNIDSGQVQPLFADLAGSGAKQGLWIFDCSAGGVNWPSIIVLSNGTGKMLGTVDLSKYSHSEHAQVDSWTVVGKSVKVKWEEYEGAGFDVHKYSSTLTWNGGRLVLQGE